MLNRLPVAGFGCQNRSLSAEEWVERTDGFRSWHTVGGLYVFFNVGQVLSHHHMQLEHQ